MAHKTRKRLTKTELKKDPVNDALMGSLAFLQKHIRGIAMSAGVLVILILIIQSFSLSAKNQGNESVANLYLVGQMYEMALGGFQSGQYDMAMGQLQMVRSLALNNYAAYPGRDSGQWSAVLAAKIGIVFGMDEQVITELQDFLATNPDIQHANPARLHLAIALENRGSGADLSTARDLFSEVHGTVDAQSQMAWEAISGLSRIAYTMGDLQSSRDHLETALSLFPDTTEFQAYQLARLEYAEL